jgi:hypothetical protein
LIDGRAHVPTRERKREREREREHGHGIQGSSADMEVRMYAVYEVRERRHTLSKAPRNVRAPTDNLEKSLASENRTITAR